MIVVDTDALVYYFIEGEKTRLAHRSNYVKSEAFTADEATGRPVTGWRVRPKWLLVPKCLGAQAR